MQKKITITPRGHETLWVKYFYGAVRLQRAFAPTESNWRSILHSTRTENLFTSDPLGIVREAEIAYNPVIKDINELPLVWKLQDSVYFVSVAKETRVSLFEL